MSVEAPGTPPEIGTDYERRRALSAAVAREELSADTVTALLESSRGISSDHELAKFLIELASTHPIDEELRPVFERAVARIGSSYERERVVAAAGSATLGSD